MSAPLASQAKCTFCDARATRLYQGKPYCALHYTVLINAPKPGVSMAIPDSYSKADPNYRTNRA